MNKEVLALASELAAIEIKRNVACHEGNEIGHLSQPIGARQARLREATAGLNLKVFRCAFAGQGGGGHYEIVSDSKDSAERRAQEITDYSVAMKAAPATTPGIWELRARFPDMWPALWRRAGIKLEEEWMERGASVVRKRADR